MYPKRTNNFGATKKVLLIGVLAIFAFSLGLSRPAYAASVSGNVQASIAYSVVNGGSPSSSYFVATVTAFSDAIRSTHMVVTLSTSVNSTVYNSQSCSLKINGQNTYSSCTFDVPYQSSGDYTFTATGVDNQGNTLFAQAVDPFIELEW